MERSKTRRKIVRGTGILAVGGLTGLAGCSEDIEDAANQVDGGLSVAGKSAESTTFGNVVVRARVQNSGGSSQSGTLIGQVEIEGGDTYTERRQVTVRGSSTNTFELEFDIDISESLSGGRYRYTAYME